jgi:hypothetical protein
MKTNSSKYDWCLNHPMKKKLIPLIKKREKFNIDNYAIFNFLLIAAIISFVASWYFITRNNFAMKGFIGTYPFIPMFAFTVLFIVSQESENTTLYWLWFGVLWFLINILLIEKYFLIKNNIFNINNIKISLLLQLFSSSVISVIFLIILYCDKLKIKIENIKIDYANQKELLYCYEIGTLFGDTKEKILENFNNGIRYNCFGNEIHKCDGIDTVSIKKLPIL